MGIWDAPRSVAGLGLGLARASVRSGLELAAYGERVVRERLTGETSREPVAVAAPHPTPRPTPRPAPRAEPTPPPDLASRMSGLLDRAVRQSTSEGREELFHKILDQLVPDEARILSALSGGRTAPLMHVRGRSLAGLPGEPLLTNACLVGKEANLALPQQTPTYVGHLLALGLVESGPEDTAMHESYQILGADPAVLRAIKRGTRGPLPPILERHTLRLSALGEQLWNDATGEQA